MSLSLNSSLRAKHYAQTVTAYEHTTNATTTTTHTQTKQIGDRGKACATDNAQRIRQTRIPQSTQRTIKRQRQLSTQLKLDRGQCADCGLIITAQNVVCIDWDHRDPSTKQFTISYLIGRITDQQLIEEINKCQALCSNCHRIRTHNERHYNNNPHPNKTNRGSRQSLRHR